MAKMIKKAADGYTNYGSKAGTPSPVTDYAGKPGKQDSYTQYKKGGVIKKKAQSGDMVSKLKTAAQKGDTSRKMGMNFDKKSFDSLPKMKKKAKSGGSFPDLNKDGKVTKADILKGRGVIAKKGIKTAKKMKNGGMLAAPTKGGVSMQLGSYTRQIGKNYTGKNVVNKGAKAKMGKSMGKCKYGC
jgi:hypothetical protein